MKLSSCLDIIELVDKLGVISGCSGYVLCKSRNSDQAGLQSEFGSRGIYPLKVRAFPTTAKHLFKDRFKVCSEK